MAFYSIDFENGITGQIPVASHDNPMPGPSTVQVAGSTVYDGARASHGSMAIQQSPATSNVSFISYGNSSNRNFNSSALAVRAYFYFTSSPLGMFLSIYSNADSWMAGVGINASGQLYIRDSPSATLVTGTTGLSFNQWLRLELYATAATSGATITGAVYSGDSATPLDLITSTAGVTAPVLSSVRVGKNNYNTYATQYWVDSLAIDTAATGLIGPVAAESPATPFRVWSDGQYVPVDMRLWRDGEYQKIIDL